MKENTCVICGAEIPEGTQVCVNCQKDFKEQQNEL